MAKKKIHTNADERSLAAGRNITKDSTAIEGNKNVCVVGDGNFVINGNFVIKNLYLVVVDSEPFNGMEIRPHALRLLSENLTEIGGTEDAAKAQETSLPSMEGSEEFDEMVKTIARNLVRERLQKHFVRQKVDYTIKPMGYRLQKHFVRQKVDYTIKPKGKHEDD